MNENGQFFVLSSDVDQYSVGLFVFILIFNWEHVYNKEREAERERKNITVCLSLSRSILLPSFEFFDFNII